MVATLLEDYVYLNLSQMCCETDSLVCLHALNRLTGSGLAPHSMQWRRTSKERFRQFFFESMAYRQARMFAIRFGAGYA